MRARMRTRLALVLVGLLLPLVLAELAVRAYARVRGQPYNAEDNGRRLRAAVAAMRASRLQGQTPEGELPDAPRAGLVLHPYVAFDWIENGPRLASDLEHFASEESERVCEILIVGGSVAGSFGNHGSGELVRLLEADERFRDRPVRVLSHARGGHKQPQQLLLVAYLLSLGHRPDYVLNIDGFNECALALANAEEGVHPVHPSSPHWAHLASNRFRDPAVVDQLLDLRALQRQGARVLAWTEDWHLDASAFLGTLAHRRLARLRGQYFTAAKGHVRYLTETPNATVSGPPFPAQSGAALELAVRNWFESSRSLEALCRVRSIRYLHVLQPTLHDPGSKPLTELEIQNGDCGSDWKEGVRLGYPRLRELGAELRASGIAFIDASQVFARVPETLYHDACHFSTAGNELLARRIAQSLLEPEGGVR